MTGFDERTGCSWEHLDFIEGRRAFESGDLTLALACFQRSAATEPHFKTSFFLHKTLAALGRTEESFLALAEAYQLNPRHSQVAVAFAGELARRGEVERALRILDDTLVRHSDYGPARELRKVLGAEPL